MTFDELVKQYERLINKLVVKFNFDNYSKDDIRQEILLQLHAAQKAYDETRGSFINLFIRLVNQRFYTLIIKKRVKEVYMPDHDIYTKYEEEVDEALIKNRDEALWQFVGTLKHGRTIYLHYVGGLEQKRIAQIEGVSQQAINDRLKYAYPKIAKFLEDYYK